MKYGLMELFQMHHSDTRYGVAASDRIELFHKAKALGFDGIELGMGCDYATDPLWTGEGGLRQMIWEASAATGVEARSLCLHLLNCRQYSPASGDPTHRATAQRIVEGALEACHMIGASVILLPFFGTSTLEAPEHIAHLVAEMRACALMAESLGICLALETSLDARRTCKLLDQIHSEAVRVYFDTGNAMELGYDPLRRIGFDGYLVLELPTSDDATTHANLSYLKGIVEEGRGNGPQPRCRE